MAIAIKVENLSKKYTIAHYHRGRHTMLRDALAERLGDLGRRLRHPLRASAGEPMAGLSTSEEFWALRDLDFCVPRGEILGIVGSNGAGKSTLLKILSRITEPTSGSVGINGRVNSLLEVGTGFHGELTGRENIFLNGSILGMSRAAIKRKFDRIVAFAEVEKFLDTPMKRYSSGMQVRLAFAIAAHLEPEVLIIDEVLAVGDTDFQRKCLEKMRSIARDGDKTILFVSHTLATVQAFCNRCLLLERGRITRDGPPAEVIRAYLGATHPGSASPGSYHLPAGTSRYLRQIRTVDGEGTPTPVVASGSDLRLEFFFEHLDECRDPALALQVENADGVGLLSLGQELAGMANLARQGELLQLAVTVTRLPLLPGDYWLNLQFQSGGLQGEQNFDHLLKITVTAGDGSDTLPTGSGEGLIALQGHWHPPRAVPAEPAGEVT